MVSTRMAVLVTAALAGMAQQAQANPTGPAVASGTATFATSGPALTVTNSPNAIINWQTFSVGAGELTRFNQASAASAVLNRVTTQNPSTILGMLQSNGRVFLINPSGILFGAGSQVDVAGLVASSLNLSDADFLAGRLAFTGAPGAGPVLNNGTINATGVGAPVFLVGPAVVNGGIINSPTGEVILAAGNSVQIVEPGTPNLRVEITAPAGQPVNLGQVIATTGQCQLFSALVSQNGVTRATTAAQTPDGRVVLTATETGLGTPGTVTLPASSTVTTGAATPVTSGATVPVATGAAAPAATGLASTPSPLTAPVDTGVLLSPTSGVLTLPATGGVTQPVSTGFASPVSSSVSQPVTTSFTSPASSSVGTPLGTGFTSGGTFTSPFTSGAPLGTAGLPPPTPTTFTSPFTSGASLTGTGFSSVSGGSGTATGSTIFVSP
jgi:filamentous hemagglutinin family protein